MASKATTDRAREFAMNNTPRQGQCSRSFVHSFTIALPQKHTHTHKYTEAQSQLLLGIHPTNIGRSQISRQQKALYQSNWRTVTKHP